MLDLRDTKYSTRRKFWAVTGKVFVHNSAGELVCYVQQKLFKLKEDITVYRDESKNDPVLQIKARDIVDFSAAYDVIDVASGEKVGALKRRGFKSIVKDEWIVMDAEDNEIARLGEKSGWSAFLSRLIKLVPQKYKITMSDDGGGEGGGAIAATIKQKFSFYVHKFDVEFADVNEVFFDRRLGLAGVILLLIIEGRQQ